MERDFILHITTSEDWRRDREAGVYSADSLATEGLIHCSRADQVVLVANSRYRGVTGLLLLVIDTSRVAPEIRYEGEIELFPHIYGALNTDSVVSVLEFPTLTDGSFALPDDALNIE